MIISASRDVEISTIGDFKTKKASISERGIEFIIDSLSDNLYSDIIRSIVREYTSNMQDAINVENKLDKPCYVIFSKNPRDNTRSIEFQDYGSGMSPDFMTDVFMNWGDSTKRENNVQIGGWGLGSKVGLAYQNQIYITTIVNNICYEYILYKTDGLPELVLLNSFETDKTNGTTVRIEIKNGDLDKFHAVCKTELSLFNNVIVMDQSGYHNFDNGYQVYSHDLFYIIKRSRLAPQSENSLVISLGFVPYYIYTSVSVTSHLHDVFKEMDRLKSLGCIVLKFNIGEIDVTLSRESVKFTEKTVRNLITKIKEADQYFYKHIEKIYDNDLDAVTRFSTINLFNKEDEYPNRLLNFRAYVALYYKNKEHHFFETSSVLLNTVVKNRILSSNAYPDDITKFMYQYCVCESNIKNDFKYRLKYFNLESRDKVLIYKEKLRLHEYEDILSHFIYNFDLFQKIKNNKVDGNIGYAVMAKQQLVRSIKKNFINLESVPQEYINAERKKDLDEISLMRKEAKAKEQAKGQEESIRSLESRYYTLKRRYQHYVDIIYGARLAKFDYMIASKNVTYVNIVDQLMMSNNLRVTSFIISKDDVSNNNETDLCASDFFIEKYKKDINLLCKNSEIEIIHKDADVISFIEKYTDIQLLTFQVYKSMFVTEHWVDMEHKLSLSVYNKFINHKLPHMEDFLDYLRDERDTTLSVARNIVNEMEKIPKFTKIISKIKKNVLVTLPRFKEIYAAHATMLHLYPKYEYSTFHFVKEICNNISIKPLKH